MNDRLPDQATGHSFAFLIDQQITHNGAPLHAHFVVTGTITRQSRVGTMTYLSISTQCLLGSNNQMSIIFNQSTGTFALSSPLTDESNPEVHLPIKAIVFGQDDTPTEDWRRFLEALGPTMREAIVMTEIGNPLEQFAVNAGVCLKVGQQDIPFSRFEGFVMRHDGHMTITVSPAEVARSEVDRCSISRLEHAPTDTPGQWSAMTFSHARRGWRVRDQVHATGPIRFT